MKVQDLVTHMKKYKDTVFIIGPSKCNFDIKEFNENYNRKTLKRDANKLLKYFFEKIYSDKSDNQKLYDLIINKLNYSCLIKQDIYGPYDLTNNKIINLHGNVNLFKCSNCNAVYTKESLNEHTKCEVCSKLLRPTVLLSGERYDFDDFNNIKEFIKDTHTLFLINIDYKEQVILDLIADYGEMKSDINSRCDKEEDQRMLVSIQSSEEEFNPNEITFCEFLVKDNPEKALLRFIEYFNK